MADRLARLRNRVIRLGHRPAIHRSARHRGLSDARRPRDRVDQDGSDTVAFGLHHALDIIRTGGPNIIEIFADDAHILGSDELGDMILALKPLVLTTLPLNGLEGTRPDRRRWRDVGPTRRANGSCTRSVSPA